MCWSTVADKISMGPTAVELDDDRDLIKPSS
jgi:hypothetical protein